MKKNNVLYPLLGLRVHLNRCLPMKLMILLVFVFSIPAFSAAYSQEGSVSFSAENMRVEERDYECEIDGCGERRSWRKGRGIKR